ERRGDEGEGAGDDLVAGTDPNRAQGQLDGVGAGGDSDGLRATRGGGKLLLELSQLAAEDEVLSFGDAGQGGLNLRTQGRKLSLQIDQRDHLNGWVVHVHQSMLENRQFMTNRGEGNKSRAVAAIVCYNNGSNVARTLEMVPAQRDYDVVVIDDGSTDDTSAYIAKFDFPVVRHPQNRGVGAAIKSGIRYALDNGYDLVCILAGNA